MAFNVVLSRLFSVFVKIRRNYFFFKKEKTSGAAHALLMKGALFIGLFLHFTVDFIQFVTFSDTNCFIHAREKEKKP